MVDLVQFSGAVMSNGQPAGLQVFSTCPSSSSTSGNYLSRVTEITRWSEAAGCCGLLIYTDNSVVDPWLVAQIVIQNSEFQAPLVAVQPIYMHPYMVAKKVATLAWLHGRRVCLNMVAGGFKNDLTALNDTTPHDSRYDRLIEYTAVIQKLLEGGGPVSTEGAFYRVTNLSLQPRLAPELMPDILVSGSSEAGMAAARALGAIAIKYPKPPGEYRPADTADDSLRCGVRIGIVARENEDEAWSVAYRRFPDDRKGQMTRMVASKVSDSAWHGQLSRLSQQMDRTGAPAVSERSPYWLHPFENYQTNCPYLVGSYQAVAAEIAGYIASGNRTYILDIPAAEEEFIHVGAVFQLAARLSAAPAMAGAANGTGIE
jgi:alkanesulfonate monooxygenase